MNEEDLEKYCSRAVEHGATHAKVIHTSSVVTAEWVRLKCQFGCDGYGMRYGCPPDSPTPEVTRAVLAQYHRAILIHREAPTVPGESRLKLYRALFDNLVELEGEVFKDGFYKAFVFLSGPCHLCKECAKPEGQPCTFGMKARPSMEACGIDVYQTARNNGFFIKPLKDKSETQNTYCLLLVE